jgi:hypothetical protein
MRLEDAPPAGWYPDPEGSSRLRWWEGDDWTNRYRVAPGITGAGSANAPQASAAAAAAGKTAAPGFYPDPAGGPRPRWWNGSSWTDQLGNASQLSNQLSGQASQIVDQVRTAAREEADRAARAFGAQARHATREIVPLVTEYTNRAIKLMKRLAILAVILVVAWFVFQAYANATFFDWLGDRIDNLGNDGSLISAAVGIPAAVRAVG